MRFLLSSGMILKDLFLMFISMIPAIENKGSIAMAAVLRVGWTQTFVSTTAGTLLPIPFVLRKGDTLIERLRKNERPGGVLAKLERLVSDHSRAFERYCALAILFIVAIPFTGVGAWGGALIADLLGLNKKHSMLAIVAGIFISSALTVLCTYGLWAGVSLLF